MWRGSHTIALASLAALRALCRLAQRGWHTLFCVVLLLPAGPSAFAQPPGTPGGGTGGLPTMPLPTEAGGDTNNVLNVLWGSGRFVLQMLLILLGAAIFAIVVVVCVRKFLEINERDGKLTEVIPVAGVGLMLLLVSAILLTIGWGIITNTTLTL